MTAQTTIEAILYDLGNVLIGWDPYAAFDGLSRDEVDAFFAESSFLAHNHAQDAGRSWAELRDLLASADPRHGELVDLYVENFSRTLTGPVPGSAALVDELDRAGLALYGLTNWSAELFHHAEPSAPAIGRLRGIVVSGEVGLAKPDPAIFDLTTTRFGLEPGRTVFVDDSLPNVEAAAERGYVAVHFTTTEDFRVQLRELGVQVCGSPPARS
ncbi:2-haloacid dehalogenase [Sanguibacter gelidistatuariae]|uniref:2-haloacid dehalogenase n=1 Tax=Sanguibacter gelidistatuariae TaxID=1814289 RepID=A0A1G6JKN1_9MICO|nr:HAD family phosphatase [Sanguibacter gelidistatuariae]SDC19237.1 2-haloacid dehalogenase [Sanguibacter gelidistatuariae]